MLPLIARLSMRLIVHSAVLAPLVVTLAILQAVRIAAVQEDADVG